MAFHINVFLNCPFRLSYQELLKPLLFTIRKIGFTHRIALERFDSSEVQLDTSGMGLSSGKIGCWCAEGAAPCHLCRMSILR